MACAQAAGQPKILCAALIRLAYKQAAAACLAKKNDRAFLL
jgi:hypothetical protein